MGKVISLKLTKQEERIVRRLNQEGITNSDLLRSALWDYFEPKDDSLNKVDSLDKEVNSKDEADKQFFYETFYQLNTEVNFLREQNIKFKEEFSEEINRLKEQISDDSTMFYSKKDEISPREQYVFDIRKNIDEILKNR